MLSIFSNNAFSKECIKADFTANNDKTITACFEYLKDDIVYLKAKLPDSSFKTLPYPKEIFKQILVLSDSTKFDLTQSNWNLHVKDHSLETKDTSQNHLNGIESEFVLQNGSKKIADFYKLKNDTVYLSGRLQDGSIKEVYLPKNAFTKITFNSGVNLDLSLSNYNPSQQESLSNPNDSIAEMLQEKLNQEKLKNKISLAQIDSLEAILKKRPKPVNKTYVYISTEPEGAVVSINKVEMLDITPLGVNVNSNRKLLIEATWNVNNMLWAGKKQIDLATYSQDTIKVFIKMKKAKPKFIVKTLPTKAEIYIDTLKNEYLFPKFTSDYTFIGLKPGNHSIQLVKEGYRDTILNFYVDPLDNNILSVELNKEFDSNNLEIQKNFLRERTINKTGKIVLYSSIAPLAGSIVTILVANKYYDKAKEIQDQLKQPSISGGQKYEDLRAKNRSYYEKAQAYRYTSYALGLTAVINSGIGFILYF